MTDPLRSVVACQITPAASDPESMSSPDRFKHMTTHRSDEYAWFDPSDPGTIDLSAAETDPRKKPWGLLYEFDRGAPMSSWIYTWYGSPEEVAHLIREVLPHASGILSPEEIAARQQAMDPVLARLVGPSPSRDREGTQ